jgi:hypothetical protein
MRGVLAIGLLGGLLYLGSKLWSAKKIGDKSIVRTQKPRISKISLAGLTVATDLYVDNPTNGTVRVSKPVVTFSSGGNYIASSVPSQDMFEIKPLSQSSLGTTEVEIPWTALTPYISGLLSRIPAIAANTDTNLQSLNIPLEYSYSLYVNDLYYQSAPEKVA